MRVRHWQQVRLYFSKILRKVCLAIYIKYNLSAYNQDIGSSAHPTRISQRVKQEASIQYGFNAVQPSPAFAQHSASIRSMSDVLQGYMIVLGRPISQTRDVDTMLLYCWASVAGDGSTWKQHWFNGTCLLGLYVLMPENMRHRAKVGIMLGQRLRRRDGFQPTFVIRVSGDKAQCSPNRMQPQLVLLSHPPPPPPPDNRRWPNDGETSPVRDNAKSRDNEK